MAAVKFPGNIVAHSFTVINKGQTAGVVTAYAALGVQNFIGLWATHPGTQVEVTLPLLLPGASKGVNLYYTLPADIQRKGYGARAWLVDPATGKELASAVIGEAVTVIEPGLDFGIDPYLIF